jgi:hypothetical protein
MGAQRVVQLDALCASSYKMFVEDEDGSYLTDRGGEVGSEGGPRSEIEPLGCCGVRPSTYYRFQQIALDTQLNAFLSFHFSLWRLGQISENY